MDAAERGGHQTQDPRRNCDARRNARRARNRTDVAENASGA